MNIEIYLYNYHGNQKDSNGYYVGGTLFCCVCIFLLFFALQLCILRLSHHNYG